MRAVRQAASGLIYGIVSLLLVIGSLALAQAQNSRPGISASTFTPLPSSTATPIPSPQATGTGLVSTTVSATLTAASPTRSTEPATSTAGQSTANVRTATRRPPCGAPYGWVRVYAVQSGDTLFRIARTYGVSIQALQNANCKSSTLIYVGEYLWVPFAGPAPTELTIIPTFPTPTEPADATQTVESGVTEVTPDP